MNITIAVGGSRTDQHWRNIEISWEELKERLKHKRTECTLESYRSATKEEQTRLKDVGGYVGGELIQDGGNRRDENLKNRTLLVFDIDKDDTPLKAPRRSKQGQRALIIHSTHSHTEENPSYRIIVPLSRPCTPLEYQAVARRVAQLNRIEDKVDPASFKPAQLMFWAAAPKDAEVFYYAQDGDPLEVDEILNSYRDWSNPREWYHKDTEPQHEWVTRLTKERVKALGAKQGDPTLKDNIVGIWCREYDIYKAIQEIIPDVYTYAGRDRFTYCGASTAGGAVVYDDGKFFYSYHQSDPINGLLLNSFDLCRLVKFGGLDNSVGKNTRMDNRPSYIAMIDFAQSIPEIREKILEKIDPMEGFNLSYPDDTEEDENWRDNLKLDKKGNVKDTAENMRLILMHDRDLVRGKVIFEEFTRKKMIIEDLPWGTKKGSLWSDEDFTGLANEYSKKYTEYKPGQITDLFNLVLQSDTYRRNAVKELIEAREWDGVQRIDEFFIRYLDVEDTQLNRSMSRKALVACVARAYQPGIKFDQMIIFVSEQGIGKSTLLKKLGGGYFLDSFRLDANQKDLMELLVGSWIVEIAELEGYYKKEMAAIKAFISKQQDRFRPAYGRETKEYKRTCVFFATTNEDEFLRDSSGNRRFWIMQCGNYFNHNLIIL